MTVFPDHIAKFIPLGERLQALYSLLSVVLLISQVRHGSYNDYRLAALERERHQIERQNKSADGPDGVKEPRNAVEETGTVNGPDDMAPTGGAVCIALLILSELTTCADLLRPIAKATGKAAKKVVETTSIGALQKAIEAAKNAAANPFSQSLTTQASGVIIALLSPEKAFQAVHSVVLVIALLLALLSILGTKGTAALKGKDWPRGFFLLPLTMIPIFIFTSMRSALLLKVARAVFIDDVLRSLRLPLKVVGLLCCDRSMSTWFSAFQMASILSSLLTSDAPYLAIGHLRGGKDPWALVDVGAIFLTDMFPILVAYVYLAVSHVRLSLHGHLTALTLGMAASPATLAEGLPQFVQTLGYMKPTPEDIVNVLCFVYAAVGMSLFAVGGAIGLFVTVCVIQVFVRIHGPAGLANLGLDFS